MSAAYAIVGAASSATSSATSAVQRLLVQRGVCAAAFPPERALTAAAAGCGSALLCSQVFYTVHSEWTVTLTSFISVQFSYFFGESEWRVASLPTCLIISGKTS